MTKRMIDAINELATTIPEPQESIFDIDKWKKYLNDNGYEGVLYKILFDNQKTLELMPNADGKKYLNAFGDDNFNPLASDFHKNIFICLGLDIKDFLCEKQQSIFDADVWCYDLSLL